MTGMVEKSHPEREAYVVRVFRNDRPTDMVALLPKKFAVRPLKAGDGVLASVLEFKSFPILSQTSPSHVLNVLSVFLAEEIRRYDMILRRVGRLTGFGVCKVGVFGRGGNLSFEALEAMVRPKLPEITKHIPRPYLIPGGERVPRKNEERPERFAVEALRPAKIERAVSIRYSPALGRLEVHVRAEDAPRFAWKDCRNLKLAAKLTGLEYVLRVVDGAGSEVTHPGLKAGACPDRTGCLDRLPGKGGG